MSSATCGQCYPCTLAARGVSAGACLHASGPLLIGAYTSAHAAHHPGHSTRPASDLATWKVLAASKPTFDDLRALGVPADAQYNYGERDMDGRQFWYYQRSQPAKDETCVRCAP